MNINQINRKIRQDKAAIRQAESRVNRILARYPEYQQEFKAIMQKHRQKSPETLGQAPWFQLPVESLSAVGQNDAPWYESSLVSDLFDFGTKIVTHERIAADEQKQLELELAQIESKNAALDKQIALQKALERSGTMTRAVGTTLADNPMTIPLLIALGGGLIFSMTRRKRR